ncbi:MAG: tetratricopeptide repeat protein [Thermoleophilaceae bacterium]
MRTIAQRYALTVGVGLGVVALALDSGGYEVTTRNCFAIALWWAIGVGVASSVWPTTRIPHPALFAGAALTGLLTMTGLWTFWADSAERAFTEFNRVAFYLGIFVLVVLASGRASAHRWADGLGLGIAAIAIIGLTSRLFPDFLGDRGVSSFFPGGTRYLGYPLDYWNGLGIFIGLGLPLVLRLAIEARSAIARGLTMALLPAAVAALYLTSSRGGFACAGLAVVTFLVLARERLRILFALAFAAAGGAATILVFSTRDELADGVLDSDVVTSQGESAAILIAAICLATAIAYGFASRVRIPSPQVRIPRPALAAGAVLLVAAAVVAGNPSERLDDFKQPPSNPFAVEVADTSTGSSESSSANTAGSASSHLLSSGGNGRWQFWNAAIDEFETRPLVGRGPGSYESWWAQNGSISYFTRHAHSHYLQTMGELGLIGLLLLLGFLLAPVPALRARLRAATATERNVAAALAALLAGFLLALALDWMWELPVVTAVGVAAIALLVGPATLRPGPAEAPGRSRPRLAIAARATVVVAALGLIAAQAIPLVAQDNVQISQDHFAAAELDEAHDAARDAVDVQPWAASPHLQLALVEEARGDLAAAREEIDEAIERDPLDWRLWLTAARLDESVSRYTEAEERLDRAIELNPRSPLFAEN